MYNALTGKLNNLWRNCDEGRKAKTVGVDMFKSAIVKKMIGNKNI